MRAVRALCALTLVLLSAGCATLQPSALPHANRVSSSITPAKAAENFMVSGRFAAKRGDQQGNGGFRYQQNGAARTLDLFSPTGTQLARIEADAARARLTTSDGATRDAASLAELLRQFIDIPIADAQFSAWLQGVPFDRAADIRAGSDGRIESFREAGWSIVVSARFDGDAGFVRRMRWSFDAGEAAQVAEVRWVFDEFSTQ